MYCMSKLLRPKFLWTNLFSLHRKSHNIWIFDSNISKNKTLKSFSKSFCSPIMVLISIKNMHVYRSADRHAQIYKEIKWLRAQQRESLHYFLRAWMLKFCKTPTMQKFDFPSLQEENLYFCKPKGQSHHTYLSLYKTRKLSTQNLSFKAFDAI